MTILEGLKELKKGNIPKKGTGICDNLYHLGSDSPHSIIREAIGEMTGIHDSYFVAGHEEYWEEFKKDFWDKRTKEGKARYYYLDLLINYFEKKEKQDEKEK